MNTALTKVTRNRHPATTDAKPWLVHCTVCVGNDIFSQLMPRPLAWSPDWRLAYDFAHAHALAHETRRCTTCLHLPRGPLEEPAVT